VVFHIYIILVDGFFLCGLKDIYPKLEFSNFTI